MKLTQQYIFKFNSSRLRESRYNISITPNQARANGELVSVGDSQMLRSLRQLKGHENRTNEVELLFAERKQIKSKAMTNASRNRLFDIEIEIDDVLFCPDIVSVVIDDNRHYKYIIDNKFFINNIPFTRLLCSSGNARRDTVVFLNEELEAPLKEILNNGRNEVQIAPAKFNAYFSLCATATTPVSEPYFCVIKDALVKRKVDVDWVEELLPDDVIEEKIVEVESNLFDGMGIISIQQAKIWAEELELDYVPSTFIIRNNFLKGMVAVMDFHAFSDEIGVHLIKDIWGNRVNTRDMDLIITESQFKLWNAFDSIEHYQKNCRESGMEWGISRYSPKENNRHVFANYQFLQTLDLDDAQIESLCQRTVDYFNGTIKDDVIYTLLYLLGKKLSRSFDADIFDKVHDYMTQAIILNNDLLLV